MERYTRQTALKQLSQEEQRKLKEKTAAVIRVGRLGALTASLLYRAGIGRIILVDKDKLEPSNLHRHFELTEENIEENKAKAMEEKLGKINSEAEIETHTENLDLENYQKTLEDVDIVLDGTDNLPTRFLLNKFSVENQIPWIYGACIETQEMSLVIIPGKTPCLKCIIPKKPRCLENCEERGIMNTVPPIVSSYQVTQAIKILTGKKPPKSYSRSTYGKMNSS